MKSRESSVPIHKYTNIKSQQKGDKSIYKRVFFEPFLIAFTEKDKLSNINLSEETLLCLFKELNNSEDYSKRESALIRLTFLASSNSLSEKIIQSLSPF